MRTVSRKFSLMVGLAAAIACFAAPMAASADALARGGLAGAEARAANLSTQAVSAAHRAYELTVAYRIDLVREAALGRQVAGSRQSLATLQRQTGRTEGTLRAEAVFAYADSAPNQPTTESSFVQASDRQEYIDVAVGNLSDTLDKYHSEQAAVATEVAGLKAQLARAVVTAAKAAASRQQALADAASVERLVAEAQAQVAGLKARARAQALAAQAAAAGPPVGNGVVVAVDRQLGTPARSATASAATAGAPAGTTTNAGATTAATTTSSAGTSSTASAGSATSLSTTVPSTTVPSTTVPSTTVPSTTVPATAASTTTAALTTSAPSTLRTSTHPAPATTATVPATTSTVAAPATTSTVAAATTTTPAPPATTAPPAAVAAGYPPPAGGAWLELRDCESGGNYQEDTGNGFYGAYQFSAATWNGMGYPGRPDLEPYWMQDEAAQRLQAAAGWGQWPACSAALGL